MSVPLVVIPRCQEAADCAVVALAQWLSLPYTQVAAAVATVRPMALAEGMYQSEIVKVARIFGRTMRTRRRFQQEDRPSGLLMLALKDGHHAVVLFEGVIISDGKVWNYEAFMVQAKAKALSLLTEDEE
ncbi:MAG TPA: hypothetical protein VNJ04_12140 [Gemmatimonadaceae bacterium]|nr:hypothetical protein [Gemmatimonadaceae bacterium]